ncbi:MAG: DUF169 domain-containing protein [Candidatus Glassbacteria bacterium]|nr:DUF169 domain-containing protein [Candidatus Glassbacteria bacterium]
MDLKLKADFLGLWEKYFDGAEYPVAFWYSDSENGADLVEPPAGHRCVVCDLARVRKGQSLCFNAAALGCPGGKRYLGFTGALMPDFEYFLSCGIPGKLEGERYKKTPALVKEAMEHMPELKAPGAYIHFRRWDRLEETDTPEVVVFFARADVLSGLFTLANFDEPGPDGVFAPFAAGCGSIVFYPRLERRSPRPRAVLGMFDVSARPCVPADVLTFAVPLAKFERMVGNMQESFLITASWEKVRHRISGS